MFLYKCRITATTIRICSQGATETAISDYKGSCHATANPSSNKTFNPNPIKPWRSIISFHQPWVRGPASSENAFFSFWCPHTTHNKRISTKYWHLPLLQQSPISSVFIQIGRYWTGKGDSYSRAAGKVSKVEKFKQRRNKQTHEQANAEINKHNEKRLLAWVGLCRDRENRFYNN